ncbi:hypothetical protein FKW77_005183 [Venturia effusa]|uniref:Uncharacterized protein n=1 Tax=Venturia effusa TaxID=50376 RepID=A0A517LMW1_9PEZI|nr:hypothetical protein FKW77_005183 [Venturia effusa]
MDSSSICARASSRHALTTTQIELQPDLTSSSAFVASVCRSAWAAYNTSDPETIGRWQQKEWAEWDGRHRAQGNG